ncbi:MAG: hypothetical protein WCI62_04290 [Erysipelotrichaceae bacterium]
MNQLFYIQTYLFRYDFKIEERQNRVGLTLLRRFFSLGNKHKVSQDQVEMLYKNETFYITINENVIILSPGYVEFILGFNNASFLVENNLVFLQLDDDKIFIGYKSC